MQQEPPFSDELGICTDIDQQNRIGIKSDENLSARFGHGSIKFDFNSIMIAYVIHSKFKKELSEGQNQNKPQNDVVSLVVKYMLPRPEDSKEWKPRTKQ